MPIRAIQVGDAASDLAGAGAALRVVRAAAGHVALRHHHDHEQFLFVASGGGTLQCAEGAIALAPGVALHLPAGSWHSATFAAETVLIETNLTA